MKKRAFKILSSLMAMMILISSTAVAANAAVVDYEITNPYESVTEYLGNMDNHYKTNLHTHSTYSDADLDMVTMIEGFYDQDFDILAFSDHGVIGREWDRAPHLEPLYQYQIAMGKVQKHLTTPQYKSILAGTYQTEDALRTNQRGMQCVTNAIEANMLVVAKNHVNGYFTEAFEGVWGEENDYETAVRRIHESGGVSHINHPGDWLKSANNPDIARDPEKVEIFASIMRKYDSCLGIEALNAYDRPTRSDRILWDSLLQTIIPEGKRNVWGFSNSDAHNLKDIDTSFMDFILPSYSMDNVRTAMENGTFFSVSRYAKNELGDDFVGTGAYPQVTDISVDEENDTISITGINCKAIEWVADGEVIKSETREENGEITTTIYLRSHSDDISCYVRAQLLGDGGICLTQPFICDDGNMKDHAATPSPEKQENFFSDIQRIIDLIVYIFKNNMITGIFVKQW